MNSPTTELKQAHKARETSYQRIEKAENSIIKASDIQIGDKVKILKNIEKFPLESTFIAESNKHGNKLIGKETTIEKIYVRKDGLLSYTTAIRDSRGLRWCWTRKELELI